MPVNSQLPGKNLSSKLAILLALSSMNIKIMAKINYC